MTIFYIFFPFFTLTLQIKFSENSYAIRVRKKKCQVILHYLDTPLHHQALGQEGVKKQLK
jgi:hypothetical protein